jgi:hypothetical protein
MQKVITDELSRGDVPALGYVEALMFLDVGTLHSVLTSRASFLAAPYHGAFARHETQIQTLEILLLCAAAFDHPHGRAMLAAVKGLASTSKRHYATHTKPQETSATATIKPYSDTNLSTQIGSDLTYTPTGVAINARYGIMVKPSAYSQGTTIDEISIESN